MKKRYALTLDMYIYADNDKDAEQKALNMARNERKEYDNQCKIISLNEMPFASFQMRPIELTEKY